MEESLDVEFPKISIITVSYNQGQYLEKTIQSVLSQRYPNLEYIIIDGGSTDGSVDIIRKYEAELEYWVSEPDRGQTHALKKGFSIATGDIMAWLNSDDVYEPGALLFVGNSFAHSPELQVLYGDAMWIDSRGTFLRYKREIPFVPFIWNYDHNYVPQPSTFWRAELYRKVGGLSEEYDLAMDADLWAKFSREVPLTHRRVILSSMRYHSSQKMQRFAPQAAVEDRRIRERLLGRRVSSLEMGLCRVAARVMRVGMKAWMRCYW